MRAVLWDADGVLQRTPPGVWEPAVQVVREFPGYLTGADVLDETLAVVSQVRTAGTPSYLATNQDSYRASRMRLLAPYGDLLDGTFYTCDLGVAKPSAAYFTRVADDLGLRPEDLLFLDDAQENVDGARSTGLAAERWHHDDGIAVLRDHLATHGVSLR